MAASIARPVAARWGCVAADRVVVAAARREPDDLDVRVASEEADQLGADVAGRADDPDADPELGPGRRSVAIAGAGWRLALTGARALRGGLPLAETWDRMDRRHGRMTIQRTCIVMQVLAGELVHAPSPMQCFPGP